MARHGYSSAPTLSAVHTGRTFPTWEATRAYLRGCGITGAEVVPWEDRWLKVADLIGYRGSRPVDVGPRVRKRYPTCHEITTIEQFREGLRHIFEWTGANSQAHFARNAARDGVNLARTTLSDMLAEGGGSKLPSAASVHLFLAASGLPGEHVEAWVAAHRDLQRKRRIGRSAVGRDLTQGSGMPLNDESEDLFQHAPCGYLTTSADGTILQVNATFLRWTGYTRRELVNRRRFRDLLTSGGRIYHEVHYCSLLRMHDEVREVAFDVVCEDGRRLPTLVNSVLGRDASGEPRVIRTAIFDASQRRSYERELLVARRAAEQELRKRTVSDESARSAVDNVQ